MQQSNEASANSSTSSRWGITTITWAILIAICAVLVYLHYDALEWTVTQWTSKEEYGYGFFIPILVIFFIWQKKNELSEIEFQGSWTGFCILAFGLLLNYIGELATLFVLIQYAFVISIIGVVYTFIGWKGFKAIWAPLLLLFFMIPLPNFLYNDLSTSLQLISSTIGVAFIRLFDISVYLEGNVIDLGSYKLQVVEACSGLRYLFPLATLSYIMAYIFKAELWKRALIFLSSIPITVLMNSFRIGVIGVLVEHYGISMAEGFLHSFEGWIVFIACMAILVMEMWALSKIGKSEKSLQEMFEIELPEQNTSIGNVKHQRIPTSLMVASALIVLALPANMLIQERPEYIPERDVFSDFPMEITDWSASSKSKLDLITLDVLGLDDYLLVDYLNQSSNSVNLYAAYYYSQKKGVSTHSPKACMPGGGWEITNLTHKVIDGVKVNGVPLSVNRAVIERDKHTQLVYYWFHNNARILTNEYMLKWFLFWDAFTKNRTDGALVRLTTFVRPQESLEEAEERLLDFSHKISGHLPDFIPG